MYLPKKNKPFYYSLRYLQFTCYYPLADNNTKFRKCVRIIIRSSLFFFTLQICLHAFFFTKYNLRTGTIDTEDLAVFVSVSNYIYICVRFESIAEQLSKLCFSLSDTTKFGEPSNWNKVIRGNTLFTLFLLAYASVGNLVYCLLQMFYESASCYTRNIENQIHEICGTPAPIGWPRQEISTFWYIIICTIEFIASECGAPCAAMVIMTCWEASNLLTCKIRHLRDSFRKVFDIDDPILRRERLIYCIRYHQEIIRMANKLNQLNKKILGHMSFVAAISMGFIATQIVETFSLGAVIHLLGFAMLVTLACFIGQQMQDETYNIQDSINESKWNTDFNLARDLKIVLMRCQRPIYFQSSPTGIFNFQQLILIIKAAYSYVTVMTRK